MSQQESLLEQGKAELLEVSMAREVKRLYLNTMRGNWDFHRNPYLDMWWFKWHFATVAHQHGIFHRNGPESRNQYNLYFRLVREQVSDAVKRLKKNEKEHPAAHSHSPTATPVVPCPPRTMTATSADPAAARERLKRLRDELAARPTPR